MTLPEIQKLWPDVKFGCTAAGDIYLVWGNVTPRTCVYAQPHRRNKPYSLFWHKKGAAYSALNLELRRLRIALREEVYP